MFAKLNIQRPSLSLFQDLQQGHEASDETHAEHSIASDLASAIGWGLADSSRRLRSRRSSLDLGGSRGGGGGDNDGGGSGPVSRVAGRDFERSAILRVNDAGRAAFPECHGDEGLVASHVK